MARERRAEVVRDAERRLARDPGKHAVDDELDAVDVRGRRRHFDRQHADGLRALLRGEEGHGQQ